MEFLELLITTALKLQVKTSRNTMVIETIENIENYLIMKYFRKCDLKI